MPTGFALIPLGIGSRSVSECLWSAFLFLLSGNGYEYSRRQIVQQAENIIYNPSSTNIERVEAAIRITRLWPPIPLLGTNYSEVIPESLSGLDSWEEQKGILKTLSIIKIDPWTL